MVRCQPSRCCELFGSLLISEARLTHHSMYTSRNTKSLWLLLSRCFRSRLTSCVPLSTILSGVQSLSRTSQNLHHSSADFERWSYRRTSPNMGFGFIQFHPSLLPGSGAISSMCGAFFFLLSLCWSIVVYNPLLVRLMWRRLYYATIVPASYYVF